MSAASPSLEFAGDEFVAVFRGAHWHEPMGLDDGDLTEAAQRPRARVHVLAAGL